MGRFGRMLLVLVGAGAIRLLAAQSTQTPAVPFPPAIDPQVWQDQDDITWNDYGPIPGTNTGSGPTTARDTTRIVSAADPAKRTTTTTTVRR